MGMLTESTEVELRNWMRGFIRDSEHLYGEIPDSVWISHLHRYVGERLNKVVQTEIEKGGFSTEEKKTEYREKLTRYIHRLLDEEIARSFARPRRTK